MIGAVVNSVWRCNGDECVGDRFRFASFTDDDCVIAYDVSSGDTHLVGLLSYLIFSLLAEREQSVRELLACLQGRFPDEDAATIESSLMTSVEELRYCHLIVAADC